MQIMMTTLNQVRSSANYFHVIFQTALVCIDEYLFVEWIRTAPIWCIISIEISVWSWKLLSSADSEMKSLSVEQVDESFLPLRVKDGLVMY